MGTSRVARNTPSISPQSDRLRSRSANPRDPKGPGVPSSPKSVDVYHSLSKNMAGLYDIHISQPTKCITLCTYGSLLHVHPATFQPRKKQRRTFKQRTEVIGGPWCPEGVWKGGSCNRCNLLTSRCTLRSQTHRTIQADLRSAGRYFFQWNHVKKPWLSWLSVNFRLTWGENWDIVCFCDRTQDSGLECRTVRNGAVWLPVPTIDHGTGNVLCQLFIVPADNKDRIWIHLALQKLKAPSHVPLRTRSACSRIISFARCTYAECRATRAEMKEGWFVNHC